MGAGKLIATCTTPSLILIFAGLLALHSPVFATPLEKDPILINIPEGFESAKPDEITENGTKTWVAAFAKHYSGSSRSTLLFIAIRTPIKPSSTEANAQLDAVEQKLLNDELSGAQQRMRDFMHGKS